MATSRLVPLTSFPNEFEARVVAAKLGAAGVLWQLTGNLNGPYPVGEIVVLVPADELDEARSLLVIDELDAEFADPSLDGWTREPRFGQWFVALTILVLLVVTLVRMFATL